MHLAGLDQLVHHGARQVDRDGEAVAGVEPGLAGDRRVDPDDLAPDAHQRPSRVARVDRRVGLDEVLDAPLAGAGQAAQRPSLGAHDAGRDGEGERLAQRVADGEDELAHARVVAVAERHGREVGGGDLEHRDVGVGIGAHHLGPELPAVEQAHRHLLGALDHVVVGEDVAVGGDHEPGAAALLDLGLLAEAREEALHPRRHPLRGGALGALRADVDHAGLHVLGDRRERLAEVLERPGGRDGRRRHLSDGARAAGLLLRVGAVRQIQQSGEEQPEGEGQGHQPPELEPVQRSSGHQRSFGVTLESGSDSYLILQW